MTCSHDLRFTPRLGAIARPAGRRGLRADHHAWRAAGNESARSFVYPARRLCARRLDWE